MIKQLKLRTLYALHMLAPAALVWWHIDRLAPSTADALASLFR